IKICCEYTPMLNNNIMILRPEDRKRISFAMFEQADYYMSNFRLHPADYPGTNIEYQIELLNSTILRIYKLKGTNVKLR
ncbi:MAG: phospholipid carrier-dependent glycosyltransferase, partial [Flavipsychrobacter sp.]|nr:phospholipid carrier-dependent glycosyltransferase [Flavipsychrobacter sp.]